MAYIRQARDELVSESIFARFLDHEVLYLMIRMFPLGSNKAISDIL